MTPQIPTLPPLAIPFFPSEWAAARADLAPDGYTYADGNLIIPPKHAAMALLRLRGHIDMSSAWDAWQRAGAPHPLPLPTEKEAVAEFRRLEESERAANTMRAALGYAERFGFGIFDRARFLTGRGESMLRERVRLLRGALPIVEEMAAALAAGDLAGPDARERA